MATPNPNTLADLQMQVKVLQALYDLNDVYCGTLYQNIKQYSDDIMQQYSQAWVAYTGPKAAAMSLSNILLFMHHPVLDFPNVSGKILVGLTGSMINDMKQFLDKNTEDAQLMVDIFTQGKDALYSAFTQINSFYENMTEEMKTKGFTNGNYLNASNIASNKQGAVIGQIKELQKELGEMEGVMGSSGKGATVLQNCIKLTIRYVMVLDIILDLQGLKKGTAPAPSPAPAAPQAGGKVKPKRKAKKKRTK